MYYGAGLVSATDLYPEIEQNLPRGQKRKFKDDINKSPLYSQDILDDISVISTFPVCIRIKLTFNEFSLE